MKELAKVEGSVNLSDATPKSVHIRVGNSDGHASVSELLRCDAEERA